MTALIEYAKAWAGVKRGALRCLLRGHKWCYGGTGNFTGYIERCERCPAVRQIPQ